MLRWFLSLGIWWPLAALAYCAYLTQMAVDVAVYWRMSPHRGGAVYAEELYAAALACNLLAAFALAVVVERPFMKLRRGGPGRSS